MSATHKLSDELHRLTWDLGISKIDAPTYGCGHCDLSFEITLMDD